MPPRKRRRLRQRSGVQVVELDGPKRQRVLPAPLQQAQETAEQESHQHVMWVRADLGSSASPSAARAASTLDRRLLTIITPETSEGKGATAAAAATVVAQHRRRGPRWMARVGPIVLSAGGQAGTPPQPTFVQAAEALRGAATTLLWCCACLRTPPGPPRQSAGADVGGGGDQPDNDGSTMRVEFDDVEDALALLSRELTAVPAGSARQRAIVDTMRAIEVKAHAIERVQMIIGLSMIYIRPSTSHRGAGPGRWWRTTRGPFRHHTVECTPHITRSSRLRSEPSVGNRASLTHPAT